MTFKMFDDNRQIYQNYLDRVTRIDSSYSNKNYGGFDSIISTEFSYRIGSEEYQSLNISHDQKLTNLDNIHLLVNKNKLGSNYRNNSFSRDNVIFSYNHQNDSSINAATVLRYSKTNRENNWGVSLDTGLFDNNVSRSFYGVNSNSSNNSAEMIDWSAALFLPGDIRFGTEVGISRYIYRYNDFDVQESLYSEIILDSSITADEFKEGNERVALGISTNFGLELIFMSGLMRSYYWNFNNDSSKVIPYSELELLDTSSGWNLRLISTYKDGVFINAIWSYGVNARMSSKFKTRLSFVSGSQSEFYSNYNSNHISYTNSVRNITRWEGLLTYDISKRVRLGINHSGVLNPYVYDASSHTIEQSKTLNHISIIRGELNLIKKAKHSLNLSGCYAISQGNYYSYPDVLGRIDYSFSTSFFKDKLPMKFTISPRYIGKYKLLSYQPNINMVYYDGSSIQMDNYYVDFKIKAEIGGIGLNLGVLHLNQGLSSKSYYDFVGMPGIDRIITFGVSVNFYD